MLTYMVKRATIMDEYDVGTLVEVSKKSYHILI